MKTYKNIDTFLIETFPLRMGKILKSNKTDEEEYIENADAEFKSKLDEIIKGEKTEEKDGHG